MTDRASPQWFVLMTEDENLACMVLEQRFSIGDVRQLEDAIGSSKGAKNVSSNDGLAEATR